MGFPKSVRLLSESKLASMAYPRTLAASLLKAHGDDGSTCRRHLIVLPGTGRSEFPFPSKDELVEACLHYIAEVARIQRRRARAARSEGQPNEGSRGRGHTHRHDVRPLDIGELSSNRLSNHEGLDQLLQHMDGSKSGAPAPAAPSVAVKPLVPAPAPKAKENPNGATLWAAAGGLASIMHAGRFEAHIAEVFDPHTGTLDWARRTLSAKYQPTVESLSAHFDKLTELYREALPSVMHALQAQYRDAGEDQLIDAAVRVVNQQLAEILYILSIWTSSFAQQRDGKYEQLLHVNFTLEECLRLYSRGISAKTLHTGDVFMPHFSADGPSTIPGARGPVGAHAVQVPHDERNIIALMLPIYLHEFRHDFYADVEGLPEQMSAAVLRAIDTAYKAGKFKFSADKIKLGKQTVPTIDLLKQIYVQTLSENDADIAGGVSLGGEAFGLSMISVFSAFNSKGENIFETDVLLRNHNRYAVTEEGDLVFAPHMPDFARAYVLAAGLDTYGFHDAAENCRQLAVQAAGLPVPKSIIWFNGDPRSPFKFKIEVPLEDIIQVAPVAADAIINAKLECLGGVSNGELVNWNPKRQAKVERLSNLLMEGKSEIPSDMGDVFATYVGAAAVRAYWYLCRGGEQPRAAAATVEGAAREMLTTLRKQQASATSVTVAPAPAAPVAKPV